MGERFGEVAVGADLESLGFVILAVLGGQQENPSPGPTVWDSATTFRDL